MVCLIRAEEHGTCRGHKAIGSMWISQAKDIYALTHTHANTLCEARAHTHTHSIPCLFISKKLKITGDINIFMRHHIVFSLLYKCFVAHSYRISFFVVLVPVWHRNDEILFLEPKCRLLSCLMRPGSLVIRLLPLACPSHRDITRGLGWLT